MELGLEVDETRPPYAVLAVKGEVDVYTAPRLRERLVDLVSQGKHRIVVDQKNAPGTRHYCSPTSLG